MGDTSNPVDPKHDFFIPILPGAKDATVTRLGPSDDKSGRYAFFIDVSDVSSAEAQDYLRRVKDEIKKRDEEKKKRDRPYPTE
jgi:hypothetical protein